ncbi:MAG: nucleotidyltransferase domain-containing protein [Candidatus Aminicenantia bacterium]
MVKKKRLGYLNKKEQKVVELFVKELRDKLKDEIVSIRFFGSKTKGNYKKDSDIDILILVKKKTSEISRKLAEITADYDLKYGLPLSPVLYDLFEQQKNKELGSFFFENIEKEGIML